MKSNRNNEDEAISDVRVIEYPTFKVILSKDSKELYKHYASKQLSGLTYEQACNAYDITNKPYIKSMAGYPAKKGDKPFLYLCLKDVESLPPERLAIFVNGASWPLCLILNNWNMSSNSAFMSEEAEKITNKILARL